MIRHGESEANAGLTKEPNCSLSPRGLEQARDIASRLAEHDLRGFDVLCSPYRRALQTASVLAETLGLRIAIEPAIREWGATATVDDMHYPHEPIADVVARLRTILEQNRGRRLLIISHAAPIAILTQLIWGEQPTVEGEFWRGVGNCCPRWVKGIC